MSRLQLDKERQSMEKAGMESRYLLILVPHGLVKPSITFMGYFKQ